MTDQGFDFGAAQRALRDTSREQRLSELIATETDPLVRRELQVEADSITPLGFGAGFGSTVTGRDANLADFLPFFAGAKESRELERLERSMDRLSRGIGDNEDQERVQRFWDFQTRRKSFGFQVGAIAKGVLPFALEFAATRGAYGKAASLVGAGANVPRLAKASKVLQEMGRPFQKYAAATRAVAARRPVLGNVALALGVEGPKQLLGQTVIGEMVGGSRVRAGAYSNYIANRYGLDVGDGYEVAVRVADDSYGMWSNALPASVFDNYVELFSESVGDALLHLPAAIKLSLLDDVSDVARAAARKEVANNRVLSFLGLSPDDRYYKLWSDFGFQGLVPELGEEFVGAMTRDVVHQVAPQLAEGGNTEHLIKNLPAVALGMGLGMFGPAATATALNRMDYFAATQSASPELMRRVRALKKYADKEGLKVLGRDLVEIAKIIDEGPTAAGSGALAADEFIRGRWMISGRTEREAIERINNRAERNNETPDVSRAAIEEEQQAMLEEAMGLAFEEQTDFGGRSPFLERMKEMGVIDNEMASDMATRYQRRVNKVIEAINNGNLQELAEIAGQQDAKAYLAELASRGVEIDRQRLGFQAAAFARKEALKDKIIEGASTFEGTATLSDRARRALAALTISEPVKTAGARKRVSEMDLVTLEELRDAQLARTALINEFAQGNPEAGIRLDDEALEAPLQRLVVRLGLQVIPFRARPGFAVAQWDGERKVLFIDQAKVRQKAQELDLPIEDLLNEVIMHEMIHVHVQRLGPKKGELWLRRLDQVLTDAGITQESVADKLNSGLYSGLSEMGRLEESVAFRVQAFGRMLGQKAQTEEANMPLYRRAFQWIMDELHLWLMPRTFAMKQWLKQRDLLEDAGIDIKDMSNSQVAAALLTAKHLSDIINITQRAEGAIFNGTAELEAALAGVTENVLPQIDPAPSIQETLEEDLPENEAIDDVREAMQPTQQEFDFEAQVPEEDRSEPVAETVDPTEEAISQARKHQLIPMLEELLGAPLQREDGKQPSVSVLRRAVLFRLGLLPLSAQSVKRLSAAVGADLGQPMTVEDILSQPAPEALQDVPSPAREPGPEPEAASMATDFDGLVQDVANLIANEEERADWLEMMSGKEGDIELVVGKLLKEIEFAVRGGEDWFAQAAVDLLRQRNFVVLYPPEFTDGYDFKVPNIEPLFTDNVDAAQYISPAVFARDAEGRMTFDFDGKVFVPNDRAAQARMEGQVTDEARRAFAEYRDARTAAGRLRNEAEDKKEAAELRQRKEAQRRAEAAPPTVEDILSQPAPEALADPAVEAPKPKPKPKPRKQPKAPLGELDIPELRPTTTPPDQRKRAIDLSDQELEAELALARDDYRRARDYKARGKQQQRQRDEAMARARFYGEHLRREQDERKAAEIPAEAQEAQTRMLLEQAQGSLQTDETGERLAELEEELRAAQPEPAAEPQPAEQPEPVAQPQTVGQFVSRKIDEMIEADNERRAKERKQVGPRGRVRPPELYAVISPFYSPSTRRYTLPTNITAPRLRKVLELLKENGSFNVVVRKNASLFELRQALIRHLGEAEAINMRRDSRELKEVQLRVLDQLMREVDAEQRRVEQSKAKNRVQRGAELQDLFDTWADMRVRIAAKKTAQATTPAPTPAPAPAPAPSVEDILSAKAPAALSDEPLVKPREEAQPEPEAVAAEPEAPGMPKPAAARKFPLAVVSGGQVGVDSIGLEAAKAAGIPVGGYVPGDIGKDKAGAQRQKQFGLVAIEQSGTAGLRERTIMNAQYADGTVVFGDIKSPGTRVTLSQVAQRNKPYPLINPTPEQLALWIITHNIRVLNIAGNRKLPQQDVAIGPMPPGTQSPMAVRATLVRAFRLVEDMGRGGTERLMRNQFISESRAVSTRSRDDMVTERLSDNIVAIGPGETTPMTTPFTARMEGERRESEKDDVDTEYHYYISDAEGYARILVLDRDLPAVIAQPAHLRTEVVTVGTGQNAVDRASVVAGQVVLMYGRLRPTDEPALREVEIVADNLDGTLKVRPVAQRVGTFDVQRANLYDKKSAVVLRGEMPLFDIDGNKIPGTEPDGYMAPGEDYEDDLVQTGYLRWERYEDGEVLTVFDLDLEGSGIALDDVVMRVGRELNAAQAIDAGMIPLGTNTNIVTPGDKKKSGKGGTQRVTQIDPLARESQAQLFDVLAVFLGDVDATALRDFIRIDGLKQGETPAVRVDMAKAESALRNAEARSRRAKEGVDVGLMPTQAEEAEAQLAEAEGAINLMLEPVAALIVRMFRAGVDITLVQQRLLEIKERRKALAAELKTLEANGQSTEQNRLEDQQLEAESGFVEMLAQAVDEVVGRSVEESIVGTKAVPIQEGVQIAGSLGTEEQQEAEMFERPSERVFQSISRRELSAVLGRYMLRVMARSRDVAADAEAVRKALDRGESRLEVGNEWLHRVSPWWQRFFIATGSGDAAIVNTLAAEAIYNPRQEDEYDVPPHMRLLTNHAFRSSALVRALAFVHTSAGGPVVAGAKLRAQRLVVPAMSNAPTERLLKELMGGLSVAFMSVRDRASYVNAANAIARGDFLAAERFLREAGEYEGAEQLYKWWQKYRTKVGDLSQSAKSFDARQQGDPAVRRAKQAALYEMRRIAFFKTPNGEALLKAADAMLAIDLAILASETMGVSVNDAMGLTEGRSGAGISPAVAAISDSTARQMVLTINTEIARLRQVRGFMQEGQYGKAENELRRMHNEAPLLRVVANSAVNVPVNSALSEVVDKAQLGRPIQKATKGVKASFDAVIGKLGDINIVYAVNPMAVVSAGAPGQDGDARYSMLRAAVLEDRKQKTEAMHSALMLALREVPYMPGPVRRKVSEVVDAHIAAIKANNAAARKRNAPKPNKEREVLPDPRSDEELDRYGNNLKSALMERVAIEMAKPLKARNLSAAIFAGLQDAGHVSIQLRRSEQREGKYTLVFTSERDNDRKLVIQATPQMVESADTGESFEVVQYAFSTEGMSDEDAGVKGRLLRYAVHHIRNAHKVDDAQPEVRHKDAWAISLSDDLKDEALFGPMLRKGWSFVDYGFGDVIDATDIKGNFKARPKNKQELRMFMADPFYDEMEGTRSGRPFNGLSAPGFEIPEMWDVTNMPDGASDDWSQTAFLLAYDEWLRQLNREAYDANLAMAEFHGAIERFVDKEIEEAQRTRGTAAREALKGSKWARIDELNEAMLIALDIRGWLSDGGWKYAQRLGWAKPTDVKPTNFAGWVAFIENLKAKQDERLARGEKLAENEVRMVALTARTKRLIKLADEIANDPVKYKELGFAEAEAATGFEGGVLFGIQMRSMESTERALQGQLIRTSQQYYISLLWKDEEDRPVFEDANYGVQEMTTAGGPATTGVGYRAKRRTILGYVHGHAMGKTLVRTGVVESWHRTTRKINESLMNTAYIESLKAIGAIQKAPKTGTPKGFKRLDIKAVGLQGYMAPEWIAKYLQNSLTQYGINDIENPIYRNYMRLTIAAKHLMLMFGFFHHQAFLRSYLFTVRRQDAMGMGGKQLLKELGMIGLASALSYGRAFGLVSQKRLEQVAMRFTPYAVGHNAISNRHEALELGQEEGLTIQKGNEIVGGGMSGAAFDPEDKEAADAWVRKAFDRIAGWALPKEQQDRAFQFVQNFRRAQFETASWLFNSLGANVKAAAYISYFDELVQQNFEELKLDTDGSFRRALARKAAMKTNADFGGLALKAREGKASDFLGSAGPRNPRVQMALRAMLLAPDWTESNLVTVLNVLKGQNVLAQPEELKRMEKNMYRHMWLRVGSRALTIQFLINMLLAGIDPDRDLYDLYEQAGFFGKVDDNTPKWSKFRWLDVNASLFSPTESRKFVSVIGHFGDPLKWTADFFNDSPIAPLDRKGSVAMRMVVETITGADYSGRRFTTFREIMGIDYDAGVYQRKTTLSDGTVMLPGESRAGKYAGKLSRFSTKTGAVNLEQILGGGYLWTQLFKFMPLQGRAAIEFVTGQKDAFDFLMEFTGTKYGRTYPK